MADDKPDLFEAALWSVGEVYRRFSASGGFQWPAVSEALSHIIKAGQVLEAATPPAAADPAEKKG